MLAMAKARSRTPKLLYPRKISFTSLTLAAKFSGTDDADEVGFRLYAVIGRLPDKSEIRLRVGVYGQFWEVPASWVMELPEGLRDCNAMEGE
mgnify:CR=1 FL=1